MANHGAKRGVDILLPLEVPPGDAAALSWRAERALDPLCDCVDCMSVNVSLSGSGDKRVDGRTHLRHVGCQRAAVEALQEQHFCFCSPPDYKYHTMNMEDLVRART